MEDVDLPADRRGLSWGLMVRRGRCRGLLYIALSTEIMQQQNWTYSASV